MTWYAYKIILEEVIAIMLFRVQVAREIDTLFKLSQKAADQTFSFGQTNPLCHNQINQPVANAQGGSNDVWCRGGSIKMVNLSCRDFQEMAEVNLCWKIMPSNGTAMIL